MHTHTALLRHRIHLATLYWSLDQTLMPSFRGNEQEIIFSDLCFGKQINEFSFVGNGGLKRFLSGSGEACATMLTYDLLSCPEWPKALLASAVRSWH